VSNQKVIAVTTPSLEGWDITEHRAIVSSHVVAGPGFFGDHSGGLTDLFEGRSLTFQRQLATIDEAAVEQLRRKAAQMGANALVGVRINHDQITGRNMQMFMVTAQATAVVAQRKRAEAPRFSSMPDRMTAEDLAGAMRRLCLLSDLQAGKKSLSEQEWTLLSQEASVDFLPSVLELISKNGTLQNPQAREGAIRYLAALPEESVREPIHRALISVESAAPIIDLIRELRVADFQVAATMLASKDERTAKRSVALFACDKTDYGFNDIKILETAIAAIEKRFPRKARFVTEGGASDRVTFWVCTCGCMNKESTQYCDSCRLNTWGFSRDETTPLGALTSLRFKVAVLKEHFKGR
jgi:uncharacterized protein YbjQ (UPF0145 family)